VPNENCYCEIDPDGTKDKWGIPVLRFHWKWSDYELNEARYMRESFTAILETLGGTINTGRGGGAGRGRGAGAAGARGAGAAGRAGAAPGAAAPPAGAGAPPAQAAAAQPADDRPQLGAGGGIIHEVGCVRMGTGPDNRVVNRFCQVHDCPNVFSADGGPFASHADKNPTHTIIALAWRTAEYLAEELRKGNV
jgi:choline dehydrogenase-like flavoprotein